MLAVGPRSCRWPIMDHFLTRVLLAVLATCVAADADAWRYDATPHAVYIRPSVVQAREGGVDHSVETPPYAEVADDGVVGDHLDELAYSTYLKIAMHDRRLPDDDYDDDEDEEDDSGVKAIANRPQWAMNRSEERIKCLLKRTRDRLRSYIEDNGSDFSVATSYLLKNAVRVMNDASFLINDDEACDMNEHPHYRTPASPPPVTVTYYVCTTPLEDATPSSVATPTPSVTTPVCSVTTQTRCPDTMTTNCPVRTRTVCPYPVPVPVPASSSARPVAGDAPSCKVSTVTRCPAGQTTKCPVRVSTICSEPSASTPTLMPVVVVTPIATTPIATTTKTTTTYADVTTAACRLSTQTRCPDTMTTNCPIRIKTICPSNALPSITTSTQSPPKVVPSILVKPTVAVVQAPQCVVTSQTRCPDTMTTNCPVRVKTICAGASPSVSTAVVHTLAAGCSLTTTTRCPDTLRSNCPIVTRTVCPALDAVPPPPIITPTATLGGCSVTVQTRCPDTLRSNCPIVTRTVCPALDAVPPPPIITPTATLGGCSVTVQTRCPDTQTANCPVRTRTVCSGPSATLSPSAPFTQAETVATAAPSAVLGAGCKVVTKSRCVDTQTTNCPAKITTICPFNQADVVAVVPTQALPDADNFWLPAKTPLCSVTIKTRCPDTQTTNCPKLTKTVCSTPGSSPTPVKPTVAATKTVAVDAGGCHVTTQTRCPDTMTTNCPERTKTVCPTGASAFDPAVVAASPMPSTQCSVSTQFVCMYGLTTNCPYIQHTLCSTPAPSAVATVGPNQCYISTEFICPDKVTANCPYIQHEVCRPGAPMPTTSTFLEPSSSFEPSIVAESSVEIKPSSVPKPSVEIKPSSAPKPVVEVQPSSVPNPSPAPKPTVENNPPPAPKPIVEIKPSQAPKPTVEIKPSPAPKPVVEIKPSTPSVPSVQFDPSPAPTVITTSPLAIKPSPPKPTTKTPTPVSSSSKPIVTRPPLAAPSTPFTPVLATMVHDGVACSVITRSKCSESKTINCPVRVKTVCSTITTGTTESRPLADPHHSVTIQTSRPHVNMDATVHGSSATIQASRPVSIQASPAKPSRLRPPGHKPARPPRPPRPPKPEPEPEPEGPHTSISPNRLANLIQRVEKIIEQIRLLLLTLRTDLQTGQLRSHYHYDAILQPLEEIKQLQKLLNHPKELTKELTKFTYQQTLKMERDLKRQQLALKKVLSAPADTLSETAPSDDATELTEQLQRLQASLQQMKPAPAPTSKKSNNHARNR